MMLMPELGRTAFGAWVVLLAAAAFGVARDARAAGSATAAFDYRGATARDPHFDDPTLWGRYDVKRTAYVRETWPNGRLYVWVHPGKSGGRRFRGAVKAVDPKNWLRDGEPARDLVLDKHADLLFPASQTPYRVGFRETEVLEVCRHVTIESGAGFVGGGDGRGRQTYGNVWVKPGGTMYAQGATKFLGTRRTFFRNDNVAADSTEGTGAQGHRCSQYFTFEKGGVGKGLILVQDADGRFVPVDHRIDFGCGAAGSDGPGWTGGGCFAPLWKPGRWDIVAAGDAHLATVTNAGGTVRNVTGYGNETRVCQVAQLATPAEDLNMDGRVDLLTLARTARARNSFHTNRGYGSYMLPALYADCDPFPGKWYSTGAGGVAAGDIDGDGANDLVLGGADGVVRMVLSDTLVHRKPKPHPTWHERVLSRTRILTVRVAGRIGVLGAVVTVADARGRLLARRQVGTRALTGCRGPDTVTIAVREPGPSRLRVRYADGHARKWDVDLSEDRHVLFHARRGDGL